MQAALAPVVLILNTLNNRYRVMHHSMMPRQALHSAGHTNHELVQIDAQPHGARNRHAMACSRLRSVWLGIRLDASAGCPVRGDVPCCCSHAVMADRSYVSASAGSSTGSTIRACGSIQNAVMSMKLPLIGMQLVQASVALQAHNAV